MPDSDEPAPLHPHAAHLPKLEEGGHGPSSNHWWVWLVVFAAIGFGCFKLYQFETAKKAAGMAMKGKFGPRAMPVVAVTAHTGNMPVYLEGLGTVTAFNTVNVVPRISGQLVSVNFKEGQFVKKGELLAQIDPRPYQVALSQAEANLAQAKGNLARDQATLENAQLVYQRDQELFKAKIIAQQDLDAQRAAVDQSHGSIAADQAAIAQDQAAIDAAKLNLVYTKIVAPIDGRIGLRQVDVGNIVQTTSTTGIAVINQIQPISVIFNLPEQQLPAVLARLHQGVKLTAEAYDRNNTQKIADGTLLTVGNQIDTSTGTAPLKAVFSNKDYKLFPNQFVNVRLWLNTQKNATIIPADAIQRGPSGTFVYVVKTDDTVAARPVKVGITEGTNVSIDDGLQPGEKVVTDGAEKLTDGAKVKLRTHASPGQTNGTEGLEE
ncbi:MAG TPA: MdtA/MuxA family multidrug efflux RND transporter periplasmic adaptor subunit [Bryobacteraceae bacterium]